MIITYQTEIINESYDRDNVVGVHEDVSNIVEHMVNIGDELNILKVCKKPDTDLQQSLYTVIIKNATTLTQNIITVKRFNSYRHINK